MLHNHRKALQWSHPMEQNYKSFISKESSTNTKTAAHVQDYVFSLRSFSETFSRVRSSSSARLIQRESARLARLNTCHNNNYLGFTLHLQYKLSIPSTFCRGKFLEVKLSLFSKTHFQTLDNPCSSLSLSLISLGMANLTIDSLIT